ncbi:MAG: S8 family serine peptidase [Pseudomonadota bacterium]
MLPALADDPSSPESWIRTAVDQLCPAEEPLLGIAAEQALPGAWLLAEDLRSSGGLLGRIDQRFALPGGHELRLIRLQPGGQLRRLTVEFFALDGETLRPEFQAMADGACRFQASRRIVRAPTGETLLEQRDGDLQTIRWTETLEASWPTGVDPGGPRIALIDSGLAYDLPIYRNRLARKADGTPLGYDFWDDDPLPYDGDTSRGPFLPIRHGSAVASILIREAPTAALIPFRYPRPDMTRMGDVVERAAEAGAAVLAMPLGSRDPEDWMTFADAMRAHPDMLAIVSAGNDGKDIDKQPLWPAALDLENIITVTSSDGFGRLAPGSNWGATSIDIMLPAENLDVVDFRGAEGKASGSSYAVTRLAALAARLLQADPSLEADGLREQIFSRAVPSPYEDDIIAVGWIPDPLQD